MDFRWKTEVDVWDPGRRFDEHLSVILWSWLLENGSQRIFMGWKPWERGVRMDQLLHKTHVSPIFFIFMDNALFGGRLDFSYFPTDFSLYFRSSSGKSAETRGSGSRKMSPKWIYVIWPLAASVPKPDISLFWNEKFAFYCATRKR